MKKSTVITKIYGGLGNQLFKYAAAKSLSIDINAKLVIDKTYFDFRYFPYKYYGYYYPYRLGKFCIEDAVKSRRSIYLDSVLKRGIARNINNYLNQNLCSATFPLYINQPRENNINVEHRRLSNNRLTILDGSWISYKFFKHNYELFSDSLEFKHNVSNRNKQFLSQIQNRNSISIHVRLKDYTDRFSNIYSTLSQTYYDDCIKYFIDNVAEPVFFVFSDDIARAKHMFLNKYKANFMFIDNKGTDWEHMFLMTKCRHNIIVNSTYSWWGAFLNKNKNKKVIAPQRWSNPDFIKASEMLPSDWIVL